MLYVLSRSVGQSRQAGLVSAAGLATGGIVHVFAAALGLSAVFAASQFAYTAVQYLGGLYLIAIGLQTLLSKEERNPSIQNVDRSGLSRIFYQGILVEVLNPKTALFFIAFLPQFVNDELGSLGWQIFILGILVPLTALPSDLLVATTGGALADKISRHKTINRSLQWLSGSFLNCLGLRILFVGG
jgi:threonine/homoserine/homoserine lactone efflux protein